MHILRKMKTAFCLSCLINILAFQSCDPTCGIGIENNTADTLYFRSSDRYLFAHSRNDSVWKKDTVIPGKIKFFSMTGRQTGFDSIDLDIDYLQLIKGKDTLKIAGKGNIFKMFNTESRGGYFISVSEVMFKKQ